VDSGATDVLVSNKVACKLGCNLSAAPIVEIGSATGQGRGHTVSLNSIRVGNATVSNIKAVVYDSPSQDGEEGLLGMTFLS
ncbi:retropepsin-like aspartic protease, partial [Acinetobacter baumannii]